MRPLVSIIVPCYNAEPWVGASIESALAQTWTEIEVIAVNDGSKDNSIAVLRRFEGPRVRILDQANSGASAARNAGLRIAKGRYIQFLDADDLLTPGKISAQVKLLESQGEDAVATARWGRFQEDPALAEFTDSPLFRDLAPVDFLLNLTATGNMMHPAAWLVPSEVTLKAGPWDERLTLNDDGEYFARVALSAKKISFSPDSVALYRSGLPTSLSARRDRRSLESLYLSCDLVAARLVAAEDSPRVKRALADYYQRLVFEIYPDAPDLCRRAELEVNKLGGSSLRPAMGWRQALLARLVGWRMARRVTAGRPR
jgi:glycosyltransferase involved in cell wall biosynthesis